MASHSMMFTEHEGKTYLLIYEQLVDLNQNRLNFTKDGNYIVWDVNTSTVIANMDQVSSLNWNKISVPNSVYARYQLYDSLTMNKDLTDKKLAKRSNFKEKNHVNSNLLVPHFSAMSSLFEHIIMGSINGDLHLAQASCLEFDTMIEKYPKNEEMFVAKSYPAHPSEVSQIEINQSFTNVYTSGLHDKCIFKWSL